MAVTTELTQILLESQSPDLAIRRTAERQLVSAEQNNFSVYVESLAKELANETGPAIVRQLAGIVLKNSISGTDTSIDKLKREKWIQLPEDVCNKIRDSVLATLTSSCEEARSAACQVISKTGRLDLALQRWESLLNTLMQLVCSNETPAAHRRAAVTAVGYLCEDISILSQEAGVSELLTKDQKNTILTTITHAMTSDDIELILVGCKAFYHGLLFAQDNLMVANERSFIFSTVAKCLKNPELRIQQAGWECVLQIASEYYPFLDDYASDLGSHSIETIQTAVNALDDVNTPDDLKRRTESVALAALEFWNTLCDVEIAMFQDTDEPDDNIPSKNYIKQAKGVLLPVLFEAMTKQQAEVGDLEEWTLAMAAGTCVALCAQVLGDDILEPALNFVNTNFSHENWKRREAAVLAYGSIMEGPTSNRLEPLVQQSFTHLCNALNDQSVAVRDTTAWTVGRIASFHPSCVIGLLGTLTERGLMALLLEKLNDEPRVAAFVCFSLHELASNIRKVGEDDEDDDQNLPTPLDPFFPDICSALLHVTQRSDASESNLRLSAFEALGEVIVAVGGIECFSTMAEVLRTLSLWLDQSFSQQPTEELFQLQGNICGCLNNLIGRLGPRLEALNVSEQLFQLFTRVIEVGLIAASSNTTGSVSGAEGLGSSEERAKVGSEEDAIIAIGTLVRNYPNGFERHIPALTQILLEGLQRPTDVRFCRACIGVICEVASTMNLHAPETKGCIEKITPELYRVLQDSSAPISLKPPLITTIGDLALGLEEDFEPLLEPFLQLLGHAASTKITDGPQSDEWIQYFQDLRDSVLEAFSGIIHCLRDSNKLGLLKPHVNSWLSYISSVVEDPYSSTSNISKATEVTGDLVTSYKGELVQVLVHLPFYKVMLEKGQNAKDVDLKRHTLFLKNAVIRCGGK